MVAADKVRVRHDLLQPCKVRRREIAELDSDSRPPQAQLPDQGRQHFHRVVVELRPDRKTRVGRPGPDGGFLHVDAQQRGVAIRGNHRHGVPVTQQGLRRDYETGDIGKIFRRTGNHRVEPAVRNRAPLPSNDLASHEHSFATGPRGRRGPEPNCDHRL